MRQVKRNTDTYINPDDNLFRYYNEIKHITPLKIPEEKETIILAKTGDEKAREKIIKHNLRFVLQCAKEYNSPAIDPKDLISVGNLGLIEALDNFDVTREPYVKFISYAVWWVKKNMIEFLRNYSRPIRTPYNQQSDVYLFHKLKEKVEQKYETENLTLFEIYNEFDNPNFVNMSIQKDVLSTVGGVIEEDKTKKPRKKCRNTKPTIELFCSSLVANSMPSSMSDLLKEDETTTLGETIGCESNQIQEHNLNHKQNTIKRVLGNLNPVQRQILELSFGFNDQQVCYSNDDIATKLNFTPERIRQIKEKTLKRLKDTTALKTCW